jgi:protein-tyrosine phosphatase
MFNLFKKKDKELLPGKLPFSTDMHSHILPGIDDGSPDIATSIHLIRSLSELGVRRSVATPHIIGDLYRNNPQTIAEALKITKQACAAEGIDIELSAAAEYMLDDYFLELLQKAEPLLTIHKNILLTEISYAYNPPNLGDIVAAIVSGGYIPILAHPERYHYYQEDLDKYHQLKEMGFVLQVNVLSLIGYYGKKAEKAAKYIVEKDLAKLVGTDLHHDRHLNELKDRKNIAVFEKCFEGRDYNDLDAIALS